MPPLSKRLFFWVFSLVMILLKSPTFIETIRATQIDIESLTESAVEATVSIVETRLTDNQSV